MITGWTIIVSILGLCVWFAITAPKDDPYEQEDDPWGDV